MKEEAQTMAVSTAVDTPSLRHRRGGGPSTGGRGGLLNNGFGRPATPQAPLSLPTEHLAHPLPTQLWLQSRLLRSEPVAFRPQGEDRPVTLANIRLAITLIKLLWSRFWALFWAEHKVRMIAYLASRIIKGILPAARIWASSMMLDLVQKSFEEASVSTGEVLRVAATSMILTASDDIFRFVSQHNDDVIKNHLDYTMEKAYLRAQLSLSIPALSSSFLSSLMYEAGVFAGFEVRSTRNGRPQSSGGPYSTLQSIFSLVTLSVEVVSQVVLLIRTLSTGSDLSGSNLVLVALSLAPAFLRLVGTYASANVGKGQRRMDWFRSRKDEMAIKDLGRNGGYKQEVVLFGLKEWVLDKWEALKTQQINAQESQKKQIGIVELGLGLGQESVQTAFYVLLALRALSTSLTLGSIRLYQSTASSLLSSIRRFTEVLESAFQSIFYLAAFCEAIDDPEQHLPTANKAKVDYETEREAGGMRIEAINLSFTYPGASKATLHNINLRINPGETLAIVGFNGGGKTTLVKALMGLYDHSGTLLINGRPAEEYDTNSLHARTSCLFQDFAKYSLTLRENVGVGSVDSIEDTGAINRAIRRGGAEGVLEKIGLEGQLNRHGVPDSLGSGDASGEVGNAGSDPAEEMIRAGPPPGSRGGGGQGKRGGRDGGFGRGGGLPGGRMAPPEGAPLGPPPGLPPPEFMNMMSKAGPKDDKAALSGGQWQRVALSRAFLRADQADLVVFDEPSAALDPRAEAELFQRIHALSVRDGKRMSTTIYISHRFSTVRKADQIAFVDEGTITEVGSHVELMALKGRYFELFNLQKEGFSDD